jgi:hypothetical protein
MEKLDNGKENKANVEKNKIQKRLILSFAIMIVSIYIYFKYQNQKLLKDFINEEKKRNDVFMQFIDEIIKENNQMKLEIKNLQKVKIEAIENQILLKDMDSKIIKNTDEIKLLSDQLTKKVSLKTTKYYFN